MLKVRNRWLHGVKIVAVLVCVAVLTGATGCASQTGDSPKKSGGNCLSFSRLFL